MAFSLFGIGKNNSDNTIPGDEALEVGKSASDN